MSGGDTVLADHQHAAKATPARWTPLSLLAGLFAISALVDAVSLITDIARTSASQQQALHPFVVSTGPAGGGLSNAEPMKRMGFDHFIRYWLFNMDIPLQLLLYVLVACWLYQAIENVGARGASSVGRPGRATICCLIPGINLFSSCFYLDRLWRASIDVHGWEQRSTPLLLPVWWMVWLTSVLSTRLSIYLGSSLEYYIRFEKRIIEHDVISLLALVLSVTVILRVTQAQRRQFRG